MKFKNLIRVGALGAAIQYLLDPAQGARRRAALRGRLNFAKRRATAAVDTARPTVQHAAEVAKERVSGVVHTIRHRNDDEGNGQSALDITRDAAIR